MKAKHGAGGGNFDLGSIGAVMLPTSEPALAFHPPGAMVLGR